MHLSIYAAVTSPFFSISEHSVVGNMHVVVFPWLAFGHLIPFLELSKSMAKKGHRVTFISTPRNIQRLPAVPPALTALLDVVSFPLPQVDGLPPDAESTMDVPAHQVEFLKKAFDGLEGAFSAFLQRIASASGRRPADWIVVDFAHYWAPSIASRFGVPCAYLSVFPVSSLAFFGPPSGMIDGRSRARTTAEDFAKTPEWISKTGACLAYRLHEALFMENAFRANAAGISDGHRFGLTLEGCKVIAPRSCSELEPSWLHLLRELYAKPVVPVGLMPPELVDDGNKRGEIFDWLTKQLPRSVVFVAFGSEATLSVELVHELALGLERSQVPFLWVLRRLTVAAEEGAELLPRGFEERVRDQGTVITEWIPQLKVLAHASVGSFFTHSGWGSVVEGLHFGLPLIMLPLSIDQGLIAQLWDKKVGIEVARDEVSGSFTSEDVAKAVRTVMVDEGGREYNRRAAELAAEVFDKETNERSFNGFVQFLMDHKEDRV